MQPPSAFFSAAARGAAMVARPPQGNRARLSKESEMSKIETATRRDTFANRPEGRVRRDERRKAIGGKRAFAFMASV